MNINHRDKVWEEVSNFASSMPFKTHTSTKQYEKGVLYYSKEEMEVEYKTTLQTFAHVFGERQRFSALRPLLWGMGWDVIPTRNAGKEYKFYALSTTPS